jgi:hypothetical protein
MRFLLCFVTLLVLAACSHEEIKSDANGLGSGKVESSPIISSKPSNEAGTSMESKEASAEPNALLTAEIRFAKKSSTLTKDSTRRLSQLLKDASAAGIVNEIDAYVWADQEYPGEMAKKLPPRAHDLAASRGQMIQSYIENQNLSLKDKVKIITMTERPEGLNTNLSLGANRDIREKNKILREAGLTKNGKSEKARSKVSRATVIIRLKK